MNNDVELCSPNSLSSLANKSLELSSLVVPLNLSCHTHSVVYSGANRIFKPLNIFNRPHITFLCGSSNILPLYEMDVVGFQCTCIPAAPIYQGVLPDFHHLPHYHADGEWCLRLKRTGTKSFLYTKVHVLHDTHTTGSGNYNNIPLGFFPYFSLLFNIRSPRHCKSRLYFHLLTLPVYFMPFALAFDLIKFALLYFRALFLEKRHD